MRVLPLPPSLSLLFVRLAKLAFPRALALRRCDDEVCGRSSVLPLKPCTRSILRTLIVLESSKSALTGVALAGRLRAAGVDFIALFCSLSRRTVRTCNVFASSVALNFFVLS